MNVRFSENSTEVIMSKLNPDTIEQYKSHIPAIISHLSKYNLAITGTIGSGKSTICESLTYIFELLGVKVNKFPEFLYIDELSTASPSVQHMPNFSNTILKKKIDKTISPLTFQSYVLDSWETILNLNGNEKGMYIYERCIDDSVICFCNVANKDGSLTDMQLLSLYERLVSINQSFNVPSYFDPNVHFVEISSSDLNFNLLQILDIIISDAKNNINKRIIGLSVSDFDSNARIKSRARNSESGYSIDFIKLYNSHYRRLFKYLNKHKHLSRFIDIGKLL